MSQLATRDNTQQSLPLRLKAAGLDAVEYSHLSWVEAMRQFAINESQLVGFVTADEVRAHARLISWQPEKPNAYGAIFKGQDWHCIGRRKSICPSNHARSICIWRWRPVT